MECVVDLMFCLNKEGDLFVMVIETLHSMHSNPNAPEGTPSRVLADIEARDAELAEVGLELPEGTRRYFAKLAETLDLLSQPVEVEVHYDPKLHVIDSTGNEPRKNYLPEVTYPGTTDASDSILAA